MNKFEWAKLRCVRILERTQHFFCIIIFNHGDRNTEQRGSYTGVFPQIVLMYKVAAWKKGEEKNARDASQAVT